MYDGFVILNNKFVKKRVVYVKICQVKYAPANERTKTILQRDLQSLGVPLNHHLEVGVSFPALSIKDCSN